MARLPGFRLHALDLPGFGLADPLPLADGELRWEAVRFLEATMDRLELERASFVASSMGALWSLWFALDRPERVVSVTAAGCPALIAGTSAPLPMRMVSLRPLGQLLMKMQRGSGEKVERSLAKIGVDVSALPEMRDLIVALQRLPSHDPVWIELLHAVLRLRGARPSVALTTAELRRIVQPVQLIWGEGDPFGSLAAGEMAARAIPEAELHVTSGGHAPWIGATGLVAELVVAFLQRHGWGEGDRPARRDEPLIGDSSRRR
jgi:pimeloyl-ACP methyl ester carboxylesterase